MLGGAREKEKGGEEEEEKVYGEEEEEEREGERERRAGPRSVGYATPARTGIESTLTNPVHSPQRQRYVPEAERLGELRPLFDGVLLLRAIGSCLPRAWSGTPRPTFNPKESNPKATHMRSLAPRL